VEKSPRLNLATQFFTVVYDDACSPNVSIRMANFLQRLAFSGKKELVDSSSLDVVDVLFA